MHKAVFLSESPVDRISPDAESGVGWLDPDQGRVWDTMSRLLIRLPAVLDNQLRQDEGIAHFDYVVMSALAMSGIGQMRLSDVAELVDCSLSRLSHTVSRLERKGWAVRLPDPVDGRCTLAHLTDAGWDKVAASGPGHVRTVREVVFDALTDDQAEQLRIVGELIIEAMDTRRADAAVDQSGGAELRR